ncbi:hypothetical protein [Paenibacillus tianmuensis]|uniref:hypothetical protein n=1 Tax=Paenibacillus tianmuensis TaxID=624147 RepID=UPI0011600310|nr:hypothetical protein [Paenibacillus tianmuensis]
MKLLDGSSWTTTQSSGTTLNKVVFDSDNGRFITVGNGGYIATSTDGTVWKALPHLNITQDLYGVSAKKLND